RPDITRGHLTSIDVSRWIKSLQTSQSIVEHVNIFQKDLCQLIQQLKQLVFLDIHGKIHPSKVKSYRCMVQKCFPHSKIDIEISRFRLWI
ncbi:unnamed protein product, partial [Rotaria sordida]